MGLRSRMSSYLFGQAQKRGWISDMLGHSVRYGGLSVMDDDVLQSSDVYELLQDISNQIMLADIVVVDRDDNEIKNNPAIQILKQPNKYLTGAEFMKLMVNTYLIHGEVFPILDGRELHLAANVNTELDDNLVEHFTLNGVEIPPSMIRHIKNVGLNHLEGVGLMKLGQNTLDGVMNAEKVLTDKYKKGGLLALLLKLDAHISPKNSAQSMLINAILDQLEGIDNDRTVQLIPLGKGYTIDAMKSPIEDEKTLGYLNIYKKDLGKFLNINVDTYQELIKEDLEQGMMYLHNKSTRPIMRNLEDHLSLLFFGPNSDKRIKFKISVLDYVPYSTKTNIAYNVVRTGITSPDIVAEKFLGLPTQDTPESQAIYISNDLSLITTKGATQDSLRGGEASNEQIRKTDA